MSLDVYRVIRRPLVTEKNMARMESRRQYTFEVDTQATKVDIRCAVERLFGVKVADVGTMRFKGKPKRHGWNQFQTQPYKKAVVTLQEGEKIDLI